MVRVILNGSNGKMGKVICNLAENYSNLEIVAGIDKGEATSTFPVFTDIDKCNIEADVILDFSRPDALNGLLNFATSKNMPIIICTTGFSEDQIKLIEETSKKIPVFRSANMSIGINIVNNILKNISAFMYKNFDIEIIEKHHNQKVDAPSGTAILLGDTIRDSIKEDTKYTYGREGSSKRTHDEIGMHAIRGGTIVGEHDVIFAGAGETIEIKHTALSREVFAVGALNACLFMSGKEAGLYNMNNVIQAAL
ncbi:MULTISPECIES: 4-hydroxy-tetrahydrodipicolinate reductase [Clostridium]|jgi:4-hydroxy-tetrahydrodipicolinate reductase|uniref:4-hydroxy-tetrahydrodipicolinate reductase n=2 Tax=Clostridium TaxID=1485 RepID=A0A0D1BT88_CLOBO|nr:MULTISPECIES: 4-hydroxy-tetrahydrodipicolinate reductase [Clostridium]EKS4345742.1 4-hydroxy-tetrahydrodipicolinate reductase [Clostridium botulinum]MBE6078902.1 4-hydroxy-tetrahydrodipicolinate reductase [Clostridium lundense]EDU39386.1 dihydrodipicolinate reductase [Clostridium sporogenes ATCC 15579]EKS4396655.1 4-hydroxy-tetrahydrodipicolinate reductase [Clostridium botulinum]KIS21981.1 dihydrodipicolinate reductase [Clostridium botulinum B2 450]